MKADCVSTVVCNLPQIKPRALSFSLGHPVLKIFELCKMFAIVDSFYSTLSSEYVSYLLYGIIGAQEPLF